ncbi:SusC/RagA family TonB-linked outer membrane protein [Niabella hibiscisoli]|uniref:SusC/RagA family TonB-linked outer membrane protein n=1 Tax=Niabella hibiscisoli TaxID=1825928 RepID=UPI001F1059D1|nr:SusC/RagA family TonB-linked outer membrane protein [Niabella hibiscisoli]MCH5719468.1 SusC/RagA family TonB-linked outer membrane protein [Niabella hibiscisoli]
MQTPDSLVVGVITDAQGEPVPAVTVAVKEKFASAISRNDGGYTVKAGAKDVLVFSSVGYVTQEVPVNSRTQISIVLEGASQSMNEVIIVAYGEQKRRDVTSSISTVTSKELTVSSVPTVSQALIGKIAGVNTRVPDGRPGANARLQIRNLGTPLFVIDGVPSGEDQFNNLNPEDIETLSVLKDGSAAIYGLQASNGVVLVTTKNGGINKENKVNFNMYQGFQSLTRFPKPASSADYVRAQAEADINQNGSSVWTREEVNKWQEGGAGYEGFDWSSYVKDYAPQTYLNVNTTGGSQKTSYYLSLGRLNQDAVFDGYNFKRTNLQANIDTRIGQRIRLGVKINGKIENETRLGLPGEDDYFQALLGQFRNLPIEYPYANNNPQYPATTTNFATNYAVFPLSGYFDQVNRTLQTTFDLEYKTPVKGLTAVGMYSYFYNTLLRDISEKTYNTYEYNSADNTYQVTGGQRNPFRTKDNGHITDNVMRLQLNYNGKIGLHSIRATGGVETKERMDKLFWVRSQPLSNFIDIINQPDEFRDITDRADESARAGFFFRGNYNFNEKYLVELGARYDGSWRFPEEHRWGLFPFVTAGWRITEEAFMKRSKITEVLTELKLRASYGETGLEPDIGAFAYLSGYNFGAGNAFLDDQLLTGIAARGLPITTLTWIKSSISNIGLDFTLWKGKFGGSLEVFRRELTGIPASRYDVLVPVEVGFGLPQENLNANFTQGMEISLNYNGKSGPFNFTVGANATLARLKNWYSYKPRFANSVDHYRNSIENRWANIQWGYEYIGQFQSVEQIANYPVDIDGQNNTTLLPGDFIYKDQNGDGVIDGLDERPTGYGEGNLPYLNFGLNLGGRFKGFDLAINFAGATMQSRGRAAEIKNPFQNDANSPTIF